MQFFNSFETPHMSGEKIFRASRVGYIIAGFIIIDLIISFIALGIYGGYQEHGVHIDKSFCFAMSGILGVILFFIFPFAIGTWSPDNWLMILNPDRMIFKFRTYLNRKFDQNDIQSFSLQPDEIAEVCKVTEAKTVTVGSSTNTTWETYLELKLKDKDTKSLEAYLQAEIKRPAPHHVKFLDYPITILEPGVIRVRWNGVIPPIDRALEMIGTVVHVGPAQKKEVDFRKVLTEIKNIVTSKETGAKGNDLARGDQIILSPEDEAKIKALSQSGDVIAAIQLVREISGSNLTLAKLYVDQFVKNSQNPGLH